MSTFDREEKCLEGIYLGFDVVIVVQTKILFLTNYVRALLRPWVSIPYRLNSFLLFEEFN